MREGGKGGKGGREGRREGGREEGREGGREGKIKVSSAILNIANSCYHGYLQH